MAEPNVISENEINSCPECGEYINTGRVEFLGNGMLIVPVFCGNCDFEAAEEWEHSQTVEQ